MKTINPSLVRKPFVLGLLAAAVCLQAFAQTTAFTYQGRLNNGAAPANGLYDFTFSLFATGSGGSALAGPIANSTAVSNGLFTVSLDFGAAAFPGVDRWLEIAVRTNGLGAFTNLAPRQLITSTPYAVRAASVANGAITSASIVDGAITASKIAPGAISQLGASDGSPTNAVQVDPNGLVGIGTGTNPPAAGLQVLSSATFLTPVALFQVTDGTGSFTNLGGAGYLNSDIKGNLVAIPSQVNAVSLIDVTDPTAPVMRSQVVNGLGAFTNLDFPTGVAFGGNILAIAAEASSAVTLVSITNPASPVKLAELKDGVGPWNDLGGAGSVAISSNNIMAIAAASDNAVTLVDISNPGSPQLRVVLKQGQFGYTNLVGVLDVAISGNLMAFCSLNSNSVTLVDITDASNPVKRAELIDGVNGFNNLQGPITVTFSGNLLAIAGAFDHSVTLVNISNPANPVLVSVISNFDKLFGGSGIPGGVTFSGNQMAVSGNGVALFDISTPSVPRLIALARDNEAGLNHLGSVFSPLFVGTNIVAPSAEGALTILGFTNAQAGISTAGWVGIGTTLPSAPLTVVGNVSVRDADQFSVSAQHVQFGSSDASGTLATAFGNGNHASGPNSTAMGLSTVASGDSSTAMGSSTRALGDQSVAMGLSSEATGISSLTMGYLAMASGDYSAAFGFTPMATNFAAFAMGDGSLAGGLASFAGGEYTVSTGEVSVALGNNSIAGGDYSVALNDHTVAMGISSVAMGSHSSANGDFSLAAGALASADHANTFVWADGTGTTFPSTGPNQFLIRAAAVGIGTNNPAAKLHVAGNAIFTGAATLGGLTTLGATTNTPTANSTLVPASSFVVLNPSTAVLLSVVTAIADGAPPGTLLILRGSSDVNTVTVNDGANTALGANRVLGVNDMLTLIYNGDLWVEIAYANN